MSDEEFSVEYLDILHERLGMGMEWRNSPRRKELMEFIPELSAVMYEIQFCPICAATLTAAGADHAKDTVLVCPKRHLTVRWVLGDKGWQLVMDTTRLMALRHRDG